MAVNIPSILTTPTEYFTLSLHHLTLTLAMLLLSRRTFLRGGGRGGYTHTIETRKPTQSISDMTLIKLLTRISVITWELEHHILACELLVHSGECVQLQQEKISVQ